MAVVSGIAVILILFSLLAAGNITEESRSSSGGGGGSDNRRNKVQLLHDGTPYVQLHHGLYFGKTLPSRKGQPYYAFQGIRYAATPNRFERSAPMTDLDVMSVPMLAQSVGASCPQSSKDGLSFVGKEDCLFANIFVPARAPMDEDGFPVIVFIHPGSFSSGSGGAFNVKYFMDESVIYATFNFRLGALGFLSSGDETLPGNLGLRDQITFLEWIKDNIEQFGGNKLRITIAGTGSGIFDIHDEGAASVQFLLLSQRSQGLFQTAISHGGAALSTFFPNPGFHTKKISDELECPHQPSQLFADCVKTKRLKDLLKIQNSTSVKYLSNISSSPSPFIPSMEGCGSRSTTTTKLCSDAFLTKHPAVLLSQRKYKRVPLLIGMNSATSFPHNTLVHNTIDNQHPQSGELEKDTFISWLHNVTEGIPKLEFTDFTTFFLEMQRLYFTPSVGNNDTLMTHASLNHFLYASWDVYGLWKFAMTYAHDKPVYPYIITFKGASDKSVLQGSTITGGFPDGTEFLTPSLPDLHEFEVGSEDEIFSQHLVHLWATFATHQKPVDVWENKETWMPLSIAQLNGEKPMTWYALDRHAHQIQEPFTRRMKFWDRLLRAEIYQK